MDVALEGEHVGGAGTLLGLAGDFEGDGVGEEVAEKRVGELFHAVAPSFCAVSLQKLVNSPSTLGRNGETYVIVHEGGALEENTSVVRKCGLVDVCAISPDMSAVVDMPVLVIDVLGPPEPIPGALGPVSVGAVVGVAGEASANIEEAPIRNG